MSQRDSLRQLARGPGNVADLSSSLIPWLFQKNHSGGTMLAFHELNKGNAHEEKNHFH
jgi:hypothetical protein